MFHPNCEPQKNLDILKSLDWNSDHPYEIAYDDKEGRFLRATKDIQKGNLIRGCFIIDCISKLK